MNRRNLLRTAVLAGVAGAAIPERAWAKPTSPPGPRDISYHQWSSDTDFAAGSAAGVTVGGGALTFESAVGQSSYTDVLLGTTGTYDYATWTSPMTAVGFTATQAIPSWTASTPGGSFVRMELRGVTVAGATTAWYQLGVWAADDSSISRTSVAGQSDVNGSIATDTFVAASGTWPHPGAAAGYVVASGRIRAGTAGEQHRRRRIEPARQRDDHRAADGAGHHPRGAAILTGHPCRAVPPMVRRRRGLVQPDLDIDGGGLLGFWAGTN